METATNSGELTPEQYLALAMHGVANEQWDRAAAYASIGLLSLTIGAMKGLLKVENDNFNPCS